MKFAHEDNEWNASSDSQYDLLRANRTHHSDIQWDIGQFNLHMIKLATSRKSYQDLLVITDYVDFRIYFPIAEYLDEVVQKTIRPVDVVMLFHERYLLAEYDFPCVLVPVSPAVVIRDLKNSSSVSVEWYGVGHQFVGYKPNVF
ncbi:hypothetical protein T01_13722 [Trichinella spiralis]|uniref:Uncharacterized protein n=1 Tax=Trichinella spiralis TaxID=6334 RepID=A0A0V1ANU7_TRISP|nr:hypothetical protein T01_13722 [Trichinella spiralis]